ncbi:MAG: hypothetical protein GOU98_04030 [Candidatus Altiarchaeota archaeon]|nr:hypothetical protein [Candidatus Altiarchaeota archaeon]
MISFRKKNSLVGEIFENQYKYQIAFEEASGNPAKLSNFLSEEDFDPTTFFTDYVEYRRAKMVTDFAENGKESAKRGDYALNSYLLDFGSALFFDHLAENGESNEIFERALYQIAKLVPESLRQYKNLAIQSLIEEGVFSDEYNSLRDAYLDEFDQHLIDYIKHAMSMTDLPVKHLWQDVGEISLGDSAEVFDKVMFIKGDYLKSDFNPLKLREEILYAPILEFIEQDITPLINNIYTEKHKPAVMTRLKTSLKELSYMTSEKLGVDFYTPLEPHLNQSSFITSEFNTLKEDINNTLALLLPKYTIPSELREVYTKAQDYANYASRCC